MAGTSAPESSESPLKGDVLLEMRAIRKSFPGVQALRGVDLQVRSGEVVAVVGENGAGKSTVVRILGGALRPDAGEVRMAGSLVSFHGPADSQRAGVAIIHQELNLVPGLSVWENIFLGREKSRFGLVAASAERCQAAALFARLGVNLDIEQPCRSLSVAQQQMVEIAKALAQQARILVLDEPTASLPRSDAERLLQVLRELRARGLGLIFVSHRLEEIYEIADRVVVLRDGATVAERDIGRIARRELIERMVGRTLEEEFPRRSVVIGEKRLVVRNLCRGRKVRNVSLSVRRGEVLGLTGLVGAGRTELVRCLFGADRADSGDVELDGRRLDLRGPREAIAAGIALLTEDRKGQGLVLDHSVQENFGLPNLRRFSRGGVINDGKERRALDGHVRGLRIRVAHEEQSARYLSGGNQQKLVLAKWLERQCEVVIFDEPTRGIDVGGRQEVYRLINELAAQGKALLVVSSDLPEVLGVSDRLLVMHEGRLTGEIEKPANARPEDVLHLAVG
ncbi:MAG TPA: sugar ABC transporter ATP-binding protein [Verrucomicrobiota bacterium]|nr:sugar ABC transporter ATP-binding protein [Verrucomicrobiota bacterium]